jgi:hypothetical protein
MRNPSSGNRFYVAYRKIRFIARKGSLFTFSNPHNTVNAQIPQGVFSRITLNSLMLFLIAYVVIYVINLFITGYTAVLFDIPSIVYHYDVDYLIRGIDWTSDSVSGVFSSGPIAMLVLSLLLLILYKSVETETGLLRLLILWMIFHGLTRFFGEIIVGAFLGKGFGFVMVYWFVMDTGKVIFTILGSVAMLTVGIYLTRISLYSANIFFNDLVSAYRVKFIFCQFFLPFFIGNILIWLIKLPHVSYFDLFLNSSMIFLLISLLVKSSGMEDFYFDQEPRIIKVKRNLVITTVVLLLLFRLILGMGIRL